MEVIGSWGARCPHLPGAGVLCWRTGGLPAKPAGSVSLAPSAHWKEGHSRWGGGGKDQHGD